MLNLIDIFIGVCSILEFELKKNRLHLKISFIVLCILVVIFSGNADLPIENNGYSDSIEITLTVTVFDIDPLKKNAEVQISLYLTDFPYNATEVDFSIWSREPITIACKNSSGAYKGDSGLITDFQFYGYGENFPFDFYQMNFQFDKDNILWKVGNESDFLKSNLTFGSLSSAIFSGSEKESLMGTWQTERGGVIPMVPIKNDSGVIVVIRRNPLSPFCLILLPIVLSFYLLGASIFIKRRRINLRLTVYLSLFLFAAPFLFAIQAFLPSRSALSIPEFLLTTLMTGNCWFIIMSIIPTGSELRGSILDAFAVVGSAVVFLILFNSAIARLSWEAASTIFAVQIAAYVIPAIYTSIRVLKAIEHRHRTNRAFSQYIT